MSIVKTSMNYMFVLTKAKRKSEVREISDLPKVMQHINERACGGTKVSGFQARTISIVPCASPVRWWGLLTVERNV